MFNDHKNRNLPSFNTLNITEIPQIIESLIFNIQATTNRVSQLSAPNWVNLIEAITDQENALNNIWSPIAHLNMVMNTAELRAVHSQCLNLLTAHTSWQGQHYALYKAIKTMVKSDSYQDLTAPQKKVLTNKLQNFELTGINLPQQDKQRFAAIQLRLAELGSNYANNVLDATNAYYNLITDKTELTGLPDYALDAAYEKAKSKGLVGWAFTLDMPSYLPVMTFCNNRQLRKDLNIAFDARASECGPHAGTYDNSTIMGEILKLRHEQAQLLGFNSFADMSLSTKMAESPAQVVNFLNELAVKSRHQAESDMAELSEFAKQEYDIEALKPWDMAFYSEKLKQKKFAISEQEIKLYFPEQQVLSGLFSIINQVFGVQITQATKPIDKWHPDVQFFDVHNCNSEYMGSLYLDLYARDNKRGGAWMADCVNRYQNTQGYKQSAVAFVNCNFSSPSANSPALFTHKEVVTLFHEFGHALHHILTDIGELDISGINGVLWDAVELPSQLLENWCWQKAGLKLISRHVDTGEALPDEMLNKMLKAKNFHSARQLTRQLEFALFDMRIHRINWLEHSEVAKTVQDTFDHVREDVLVGPVSELNRFQHSFNHIFSGGYAAGYYSYKWAEVLSADVFSKFEQDGIFNAKTGQEFLTEFLAKGGSEHPADMFQSFMSRQPNIDSMLTHSGISH